LIKSSLPKELEEAFRKRAMEKYGYSRGAISKALEAAIKLWIRYDYEATKEEESNNRAFESLVDELESKHGGMYAVITGGELVSIHRDLEEALPDKGGHAHRIIFKIGEKPPSKVRLGWRTTVKSPGPT